MKRQICQMYEYMSTVICAPCSLQARNVSEMMIVGQCSHAHGTQDTSQGIAANWIAYLWWRSRSVACLCLQAKRYTAGVNAITQLATSVILILIASRNWVILHVTKQSTNWYNQQWDELEVQVSGRFWKLGSCLCTKIDVALSADVLQSLGLSRCMIEVNVSSLLCEDRERSLISSWSNLYAETSKT